MWACILLIGVHLTGVHLMHGRTAHKYVCISGMGVHLRYRRAHHTQTFISVWVCISGGRNEALKGRTQVCRHQREDVGHSLAEIITPNFLIQIGESEVVEGA